MPAPVKICKRYKNQAVFCTSTKTNIKSYLDKLQKHLGYGKTFNFSELYDEKKLSDLLKFFSWIFQLKMNEGARAIFVPLDCEYCFKNLNLCRKSVQ